LVLALERVERCVRHREGELALAGPDQLEIVDRAAGHLSSGLIARQALRDDVRQRASDWIVDTAGTAGRDGEGLLLGERRACQQGRAEREREKSGCPLRHVGSSLGVGFLIISPPRAWRRPASGIVLATKPRLSPDRAAPGPAHYGV